MSKHLNLPLSFLTGDRYLGADPETRSTCISLHVYCVGQENGGRVVGARLWKDRKCQQVLGVTREELDAETDLWEWEGDDAILPDYNHKQEQLAEVARINGIKGGRRAKSHQHTQKDTHPLNPQETQQEPSGLPDGLAKVKKGKVKKGKVNHTTTASADADAGSKEEFYLTRRKRKLTGKRLETFDRFWKTFAYPKGKAEAADAWLDIPSLTVAMVDEICAAAAKEAENRESIIRSGKTPKYAQGWITGRRWEDYDKAEQPPKQPTLPVHPPDWQTHRQAIVEKMKADGVQDDVIADVLDAKSFNELPVSIKTEIRQMTAAK